MQRRTTGAPRVPLTRPEWRALPCVVVSEDKRYSREYLEPDKRSIANAVQIFFKDGSKTEKIEVEYPVGHRRRRKEGIPLLIKKARENFATKFSAAQTEKIITLCQDAAGLEKMPVPEFVNQMVEKEN